MQRMRLFSKNHTNRWLVLDQSFFTMFITQSFCERLPMGL